MNESASASSESKILPEYLSMYEISGQDPITPHALDRYLKDKEQDAKIEEEAEKFPTVVLQDSMELKEEEIPSLFVRCIESPDIEIRRSASRLIRILPESKRASLIKLGLECPNIEVQCSMAWAIERAQSDKRIELQNMVSELVRNYLDSPDIEIKKKAIDLIYYIKNEDKIPVLRRLLTNPDNVEVALKSINIINSVSIEEVTSLIELGLKNHNIEIQKSVIKIIPSALEKDEEKLWNIALKIIKNALTSSDIEKQKSISEIISCVPNIQEKEGLLEILLANINSGLSNPNTEIQKKYIDMIPYLGKPSEIIERELQNSNMEVYKNLSMLFTYILPPEKRIPYIKQGMENSDIEIWGPASDCILRVDGEDRLALVDLLLERIKEGLMNEDISTQKKAMGFIWHVPKNRIKEIVDLIKERGLGNELIKPALYAKTDVANEKFSRQKFNKTGSGTTLLGGELKDKTIIRHIQPYAFLTWQKLYENYQIWREAGFDYVPIEPINSYRLNEDGLVDVYSGVLDVNFMKWETYVGLFKDELNKKFNLIKKIIDDLKMTHGHPHESNFCLRFFRDENGQPDFNREPRIYLIDFDQAVSP